MWSLFIFVFLQLNQQIQEQKDQIEQLDDTLKLLQQREQDKSLTGDDRLVAVEKEVNLCSSNLFKISII